MNNKTEHKVITFIVFVLLVITGMILGDGYNDSYRDVISIIAYLSSLVWIYLRLNGFLRFKK